MSLDLEQHLTFYGAYHHNSVNVAIHMVCVPLILLSGFCMATYTGTLIPTPSWITPPYLDLNLGVIGASLYSLLYLLLEPFAGFLLALFCMGGAALGNYLHQQNPDTTFQGALAIHVVCWIFQFIGHGKYEGRAPALLDNLIQAVFLAPMFVWLEILFKFGYRPELRSRVNKKVQVEIEKFRSKNGKAQ
ncbi:related to DUF962 domain protein [Fusarium mangiferae]|uniref:Related to DUF962 domain protein n=1 Tax=Fusarium mangiferae TaxID=192010 RepID=A0A1L7SFI9_FUSMA|nr:uncharacterized protein FMAN_00705 [Fusarium mangiferae]KAI1031660.1 hypothetical protein LB504_001234 [Fusarium proliferatum]KAI1043748.1 hypothetical protein LB505_003633 [Fusarium chuoi]CVK83133.1 related to DUF962 domain protein [Fusarium mangiferae]